MCYGDQFQLTYLALSVCSVMSSRISKMPTGAALAQTSLIYAPLFRKKQLGGLPLFAVVFTYRAFIRAVYAGLIFTKSGFFVNTSRVNPELLDVVSSIRDSRYLRVAGTDDLAVCIMLGTATESMLFQECPLPYPVHKITIAPFKQEMRRDTSLWGLLFGFSVMAGSISDLGFSFLTRRKDAFRSQGKLNLLLFASMALHHSTATFSPRKAPNTSGKSDSILESSNLNQVSLAAPVTPKKKLSFLTSVESPLKSAREPGRSGKSTYFSSRAFEDQGFLVFLSNLRRSLADFILPSVLIYDGRTKAGTAGFTFSDEDFARLERFPLYKNGQRELPEGAVVAVGYTLGTYVSQGSGKVGLSSNLQFVILLGVAAG